VGNGAKFHDGRDKIIGDSDKELGKDNIVHASPDLKHFWQKLWPHGVYTIKNYVLHKNMVGNKCLMDNDK
jgi:hypothetical protein